ncbi:MAG: hypothetical protein R3200_15645, partial [Xanthomonadales bacterium]|nr:hypothetical protein [Xanthomonadales bacterium]
MSFISELKRRNVFRVALAYLVLAWLVLQVGDVLIDALDLPGEYNKFIVILLALGFVPILVFSWVFEMTPEGLKREKDIRREESITAHTAKKLDLVVIALLVLAIGMFAYDRFAGPRPASHATAPAPQGQIGDASIAVLPFVNMSGNTDNEYFSDGLTETLLHMLAQVDGLRVAARTSAFAFKDTNTDIREIAAKLNVATVLEGSVQRSGERVRITAQLVDAADGSHLWSQNFDRDLDDIFAIQDEIATTVASALKSSLLGVDEGNEQAVPGAEIANVGTRSMEAYDHYLRGLGPLAEDSHGSLPEAERAFKEALLLDPDFREARLALTETYLTMGDTALLPGDAAIRNARTAIDPLVESNPTDPVVAAYDAYVEFLEEQSRRFIDDPERIAYFGRIAASIARAPNEPALYIMVAEVLDNVTGRAEEQLAFVNRGLEVDPLSGSLYVWKGRILGFELDRPDEALDAFLTLQEVDPDNPNGHAFPGFIYAQRGEYARAIQAYARAAAVDRQDHELVAFVAMGLIDMGLLEQSKPWLERAELLQADGGATRHAKMLFLYLTGDRDDALALSKEVLEEKESNRRGVYSVASLIYGLEMRERDRLEEALAFFEALAPGATTDPAYWAEDVFGLQVRIRFRDLVGFSEEGLKIWSEQIPARMDETFPKWREEDDWAVYRFVHGLPGL